jgi:methyl-accepting chemotaxis protein
MTNSHGVQGRNLADDLETFEFDEHSSAAIAAIGPSIEAHLGEALERFAESGDARASICEREAAKWTGFAAGKPGEEILAAAASAGQHYAEAGIEPRQVIATYAIAGEQIIKSVIADALAEGGSKSRFGFGKKAKGPDAKVLAEGVGAVFKAMLLDLELTLSTARQYRDVQTKEAQTREADERFNTKVRQMIDATGGALRKIADGDLTARITEDLDPEFESIKADVNAAAEKMAHVIGQVQTTSSALKTATGEILAGANDLSERTTKQAATIEESAAAIEQVAATVGKNTERAKEASSNSANVARTAQDGGAVMVQATEAMERITNSSAKISNIIGMIDDIAFQTNLLALNASVEAARAGEAGKGFAVVAIEVRRLAQSAAEASSEVKDLISKSADEVESGSKLVGEASGKLNAMLEAARDNAKLIEDIARDSQEQSTAIDEISIAIRQMDEMTQHNAALVEETNAAIEQTEAQAVQLDDIVDVFVISGSGGMADKAPSRLAVSAKPAPAKPGHAATAGNTALDTDWEEF